MDMKGAGWKTEMEKVEHVESFGSEICGQVIPVEVLLLRRLFERGFLQKE